MKSYSEIISILISNGKYVVAITTPAPHFDLIREYSIFDSTQFNDAIKCGQLEAKNLNIPFILPEWIS